MPEMGCPIFAVLVHEVDHFKDTKVQTETLNWTTDGIAKKKPWRSFQEEI